MNFDEKAKDWDKDPKKIERAIVFAGEILQFLDKEDLRLAIEFGSGTGLVSFELKERFKSITLADSSPGMMEVLKEKIVNENITTMNLFLIDQSNDLSSLKGYDVLYTLLTLHHIKDLDQAFASFNSSLNKGGYVFIGDLIIEDGSFHRNDPEFDGHKGFDREDIKARLRENGFEPLVDKIFFTIERESENKLKKYPLFLIAGKKL